MAFFAPRDVKTTLACPTCGASLHIARTCHEVYMHCPACKAQFQLQDYIRQADEAIDETLEEPSPGEQLTAEYERPQPRVRVRKVKEFGDTEQPPQSKKRKKKSMWDTIWSTD